MRRILAATALYFGVVFGVGFLLGPIRVLWLEPALGATFAVAVETPLLVTAMVVAARWVPRRTGLTTSLPAMTAMGLGALALVLIADVAVGTWLRGATVTEQIRYFSTPAGLIYTTNLVLFAAMPILANRAIRGL